MGPGPLEGFYVVSVPTLVSNFNDVCAVNVCQHVAPVIVVLDEITLREPDAVPDVLPCDSDSGNREVAGFADFSFNSILGKNNFVQRRWTEGVCPVHLEGSLPIVVPGRELRNHIGATVVEQGAEKAPVDAVFRKVFVHAAKILGAVSEIVGVKD